MSAAFRNWFICFQAKWIIYQWLSTSLVFEGVLHKFKRSFYFCSQETNPIKTNNLERFLFLKVMNNFFSIKIQCLHFMNHFVLGLQCIFSTRLFTCWMAWTTIKCPCVVNKILKILFFIIIIFFILAAPRSFWDLSSLTRDWTRATAVKAPSHNHWTTRELPWRY